MYLNNIYRISWDVTADGFLLNGNNRLYPQLLSYVGILIKLLRGGAVIWRWSPDDDGLAVANRASGHKGRASIVAVPSSRMT